LPQNIKVGISSCLLGEKVRYDGSHKLDHFLKETLGQFVQWVPVCPEVDCGLPVPRESMHLEGTPESPRLITTRTRTDHTARMLNWASKRLDELEKEDLCGFIFKSHSPSSGMRNIRIYDTAGMPGKIGVGLFAKSFLERFPLMPVEDEGRLNSPLLRENFLERLFVFRRWRDFIEEDGSLGGLVSFHANHKLLLMAHSPQTLAQLGKLVANPKKLPRKDLFSSYLTTLMEGLKLVATTKKNTNVLLHIVGYFKTSLSPEEKKEVLETIENYHRGFIPLVVPVTLLQHFVRKFDVAYLKGQYFLHPHPVELMLRNHV
jgi:uncharacterized protein YbgA (DUF1722 family)/uncharacterized protein YbbK (DUF523 family)